VPQARRHCVIPPALSSSTIPAAVNWSRIRSDSAKSFAARAARLAASSASISVSAIPVALTARFR